MPRGLPFTNKGVKEATNFTNETIRERVPADKKKKILERANYKCEKCRKVKNSEIRLDIHHKNMKNNDNKPSNLIAVCPNCHRKEHQKYKREDKRNIVGVRERSVLVKKKPKETSSKKRSTSQKKTSREKSTSKKKSNDPFGLGRIGSNPLGV